MKILNSKPYQAYMFLSLILGLLGIVYWLRGKFLTLEYVDIFSTWTATILGLITIAPLASTILAFKPKSSVKTAPRWILRYLSIPALYFAFSLPLYFFFSNAAPCIYTQLYGYSHLERLKISRKYITGKRIDKYWLAFHKYENSLRVNYHNYNNVNIGSSIVSDVMKSKYGIYVGTFNANTYEPSVRQ
jgi:hypothetical protein